MLVVVVYDLYSSVCARYRSVVGIGCGHFGPHHVEERAQASDHAVSKKLVYVHTNVFVEANNPF